MAIAESTKSRALQAGKGLLQAFGYNGFSFQHLADALGLRKQSMYVHFKSKEDLANDLVEAYRQRYVEWAETVASFGPEEKLHNWFEGFYKFAADDFKYCPIAAFASDFNSLPKPLQKKIKAVYELRCDWVARVIEEGQKQKVFRRDMKAESLAQLATACCLGSQQVARLSGDPESIRAIRGDLFKMLKGT